MKRQIYGLLGMVAIVALGGACKDDPLADTGGSPSRLDLEFAYREVIIGDSVRTFAIERDALNTPLPPTATVRSCTPAVATVATVSDAPQQRTGFYVKGLTYGTTCVIAEAGVFSDTMQVATFPARVLITSGPDTVVSGTTGAYTFQYVDRGGAGVAGVPAATWSVTDTTFGVVNPAGGVLAGRDSGLVTLKVSGIGSPPEGLSAQRGVLVVPAPFTSTITPNPADPGQVVKVARGAGPVFDANTTLNFSGVLQTFVAGSLTPDSVKVAIPDLAAAGALTVAMGRMGPGDVVQHAGPFTVNTPAAFGGTLSPANATAGQLMKITRGGGDPAFDADTRVYFSGRRAFVTAITADSIKVPVLGFDSVGAKDLRMTRLDVANVARRTTFTASSTAKTDPYDATNDDPATAPSLTANGDYFVVESGTCTDGAFTDPGDDCDDFFRVANPSGIDTLFARVQADWFSGSDVDILWCKNATCSGPGNVVTGGGATAANPEVSNVKIPPGATWFLWINYFEPVGVTSDVIRVRLSGLP